MANTAKFLFDTEFDAAGSVAGASGAKLLTGREIQSLRDSAFDAGVNEATARESQSTEHRRSEALAAIAARQLVGLLPYRMQGYQMMPPLAVLVVPAASGIGFLFALFGRRHGGAARIGLIANGVVLVLSLLLDAAAWSWRTMGS